MTIDSAYEQKLLELVDEHGWQFTYVFDPDGIEEDFGYSVGFTKSLNAPEFIVFGLPKSLMSNMIWEVFNQIKSGLKITDSLRVSGLIEGFDCILRKAKHHELFTEYTVSSKWFWNRNGNSGNPEVYQIVWPGAHQGLFPWETDCNEDVIKAQPQLWLTNSIHS